MLRAPSRPMAPTLGHWGSPNQQERPGSNTSWTWDLLEILRAFKKWHKKTELASVWALRRWSRKSRMIHNHQHSKDRAVGQVPALLNPLWHINNGGKNGQLNTRHPKLSSHHFCWDMDKRGSVPLQPSSSSALAAFCHVNKTSAIFILLTSSSTDTNH